MCWLFAASRDLAAAPCDQALRNALDSTLPDVVELERRINAELATQPNGIREIKYRRQGKAVKVLFLGGMIVIRNLELHGDELNTAIKSRVQTLNCTQPMSNLKR